MKSVIYTAPEGYVYDYLEPHFDENGEALHLYANKLSVARLDDVNNYKLILDPREKKQ